MLKYSLNILAYAHTLSCKWWKRLEKRQACNSERYTVDRVKIYCWQGGESIRKLCQCEQIALNNKAYICWRYKHAFTTKKIIKKCSVNTHFLQAIDLGATIPQNLISKATSRAESSSGKRNIKFQIFQKCFRMLTHFY